MKEEDIRPANIFDEYLSLAKKDIITFFSRAHLNYVTCPACGSEKYITKFNKDGFNYTECSYCNTLYVNPRPDEDAFNRFYKNSTSTQYWATHFYKVTEEARQELLITPKAQLTGEIIKKYNSATSSEQVVVDIGSGYGGFCVALKKVLADPYVIMGIEPSLPLQEVCRRKNILIIPKFLDDVKTEDFKGREVVAVTSFELLEHLYDPSKFIKNCYNLLNVRGVLILTTLNGKGFDLELLGKNSKSIFPPHHINFLNPKSIKILLEKHGFEILDISTPGKLDIDIVSKQLPDISCKIVRDIISASDESIKENLQIILQKTKTSSHMMVVARKK
jgi:2-polyprenyl-3-methyl-5-hydroxy-6-metoxy-1,4-benzoquinol methylase